MTGSPPPRSGLAAISAHRGGREDAPSASYEAYRSALETGAEYVEFDIRRTADEELVVYHNAGIAGGDALADISYSRLCKLAGYEVPRVADIMHLIAGKAIGHLDLKELGGECAIIEQAIEVLGLGNFVATTLEDASVAAIKDRFPNVPVALSLGRDLSETPWLMRPSARRHDLYPLSRIRVCGADWTAIHRRLALAGVLRQCHQHGIRTMIWTVNSDRMIAHWLADPRVDVVVTDRPRHAVALRQQLLHNSKMN
jgi:glycerophosphoryl diester phosphodiesterase